jgi:catechol 2,3-dioxygenase-like lactoylglutathione lyase family enzyme
MSNLSTPAATANRPVTFRSNRDIAVHVPDLALARKFYGGVLAFPLIGEDQRHLIYDTGTFRLYVTQDSTARAYVPSFDVPNIGAARRHLEAAGCAPLESGPSSYMRDPFGFVFDIIERK